MRSNAVIWPAIAVTFMFAAVGSLQFYKQLRIWLNARNETRGEAAPHGRHSPAWGPANATRRPRLSAIVLAGVVVGGLAIAAMALLIETIAHGL
jgi:hypothetical protein